jgi:DNA helicase II / ATP-dependent DNA helicase PcrA
MLTRLSAMLPINTRGMWIGTFHGLCNRMLRAHHRDAGCRRRSRSSTRPGPAGRDQAPAEGQQHRRRALSAAQRADVHQQQGEGRRAARKDVEVNDDYNRKFVELYALYDAQCKREGVCDFAELLLRSYELLTATSRCASITRSASATSWSTSSRTPTSCSTRWLKQLAGRSTALSRWATTTSRSTPSAAPTSATWPTSSASSGSPT